MSDEREPQITEKGAFLVAGTRYEGRNEHGEIPAMWEHDFLPRVGELAALRPNQDYYGVERSLLPTPETGLFEYLAGVEVTSIENLPEGMVGVPIPAQRYAVLPAHGLPDLARVWPYLLFTWPTESRQYARTDGYCFEHYPPTFPKDSIVYVYVAVRAK